MLPPPEMPTTWAFEKRHLVQEITPPSSVSEEHQLPSPPSTGGKLSCQAKAVLAQFKQRYAGESADEDPWKEYQLDAGDYDEIERRLQLDENLLAFVENKIRYDYNAETYRLAIRMPTSVHELFIGYVERSIDRQLSAISNGSSKEAFFAQQVHTTRSSTVKFRNRTTPSGRQSSCQPDAAFWYKGAQDPGVVLEISYSQHPKDIEGIAHDYIHNSSSNIKAVIGLDINYGKDSTPEATLSLWRPQVVGEGNDCKLLVAQEMKDEAFRDKEGKATNHPGFSLRLSDFASRKWTKDVMNSNVQIGISAAQLCQFLNDAEDFSRAETASSDEDFPTYGKRDRRTRTPPEEITASDEERITESEERAAKRVAHDDPEYKGSSQSEARYGGTASSKRPKRATRGNPEYIED
ncbi:unnamed protein product [Periconia digitata]|uniref:Uncharacterized protein n=1 Tax=Periconia digitata TaxID=1303443 RepID=A0A9W4UIT1_9PLEO|nr:unnamed protein product [Periconia digitata]